MQKFVIIYSVVIIAWVFQSTDEISYWVSWIGSLLLMIYTLTSLSGKETDSSWFKYPLRSINLPCAIFVTYMALTSIFYFLDVNGYYFFERISTVKPSLDQNLIYKAQFNYLLGHAGLLHGILLQPKYPPVPLYSFKPKLDSSFALKMAVLFSGAIFILSYFPALSQLQVRLDGLLLTATSFSLAVAIYEKKTLPLLASLILFVFTLRTAALSGFKEAVILPLLLLFCFLLPIYKRKLLLIAVPSLLIILIILPIYATTFRKVSWEQGGDSRTASGLALKEVQQLSNNRNQVIVWAFLTERLSEIRMFTQYIRNVPDKRDYYGWQIARQGFEGLIPRAIFPNKANLEDLVMVRVRENRIVENYTTFVSAKPMIVVDGFLSFGRIGAWAFCFFVGVLSSFFNRISEKYFGGYLFGSGIVFNGIFNIFWRGNCFEFLINNIFWGGVVLMLLFFVLGSLRLLEKTDPQQFNQTNPPH